MCWFRLQYGCTYLCTHYMSHILFLLSAILKENKSQIDDHESKPTMCILAIMEDSQKTSIISYFTTYSFYDQTYNSLIVITEL